MAETLQLRLGLDAPHRARAWVAGVCADHGLEDLADDAALLMSELVTNAVLHAHSDCTILVDFGEKSMHARVVDLDERDLVVGVPRAGAEHGRGLNIVAALTREWGVTRHATGKAVWFVLESTKRTENGTGSRPSPFGRRDETTGQP